MNGKIYKITNTLNGKVYIGQTIRSIELRWNYHCSKSSECLKLKNAIQKYGKENFTIEQIDEAPSLDELNKKEEEWISFFNSVSCGYNLQSGGLNRIHSVESLKKMSDSILSRNKNPEFMKKFRASILKARQNPEYRKKKSQSCKIIIGKRNQYPS